MKNSFGIQKMNEFMKIKRFFTEYAHDILNTLYEAEKGNIIIKMDSDQLQMRPKLIKFIQDFARCHKYSDSTVHLGVYILDVYMDTYILSNYFEHQKLMSLVCLLLAAKSEEIDEAVPSIKDLLMIIDMSQDIGVDFKCIDKYDSKSINSAYKTFAGMYCKLEYLIFESLYFNTVRPTTMTFIKIFQTVIVSESDIKDVEKGCEKSCETLGDLRLSALEYIKEFSEIIIVDVAFFNIQPSKIAAAILCATRKLLKIKKFWTETLSQLTRYKFDEIQNLMMSLNEKRNASLYLHTNVDFEMRDSGYVSPDSGSETDEVEKKKHKRQKMDFSRFN
ncbi:CLUMA_CG010598, isoform A [Clunio marinus]|uniref:CLUMA_CG010598, isoform A n=1 Tax=Clunio marinus TaxID=568069 RepID=A0A1J1IFH0_9DIPT|nr:CLUMA_CG010598, isoform A [Clunio marinus]